MKLFFLVMIAVDVLQSHEGSLRCCRVVCCQACEQLQENNSKAVDVHLWRELAVSEELWSHVGHCAHDHL